MAPVSAQKSIIAFYKKSFIAYCFCFMILIKKKIPLTMYAKVSVDIWLLICISHDTSQFLQIY